jgi:long-chain acyl-CoA synthetase
VLSLVHERLEQLQDDVTPYEKVVKFVLLPDAFSIENQAMTSTLKLRRKVIMERYREEIEKLYSA